LRIPYFRIRGRKAIAKKELPSSFESRGKTKRAPDLTRGGCDSNDISYHRTRFNYLSFCGIVLAAFREVIAYVISSQVFDGFTDPKLKLGTMV